MLRVDNVIKTYETKSGKVEALKNINVKFKPNGLTFILGKSGSGKTTLLNVLAGLDDPTSGSVSYGDVHITNSVDRELDKYRNLDVGIVFQDYNLLESLNVYDNVAIALEIQQCAGTEDVKARVQGVLEYVGLKGLEKRKVTELSGGQAQRVAVARALVKNPKVIFADEPTGNLDNKTGTQIIELLKKISKNCTVVVITHNEEMARKYGDEIIRIEDGEITSHELNEKLSNRYNLYIDSSKQPAFLGLTKEEIIKEILNLIEKKTKVELCIDMQESVCIKEDSTNVYNTENQKINTKRLNMKSTLKFALVNIFRRPVRTFFVTLLFSLALFLLMITLYVSRYNSQKVMAEYIDKYDITELYLCKPVAYEDSLYELHTDYITSGNKYKQDLDGIKNTSCFVITNELLLYSMDEMFDEEFYQIQDNINYFVNRDDLFSDRVLKQGHLPQNTNEIAITDYLASAMFGNSSDCIGRELVLSDINVKISGVIETDYIQTNFKYKNTYSPDEYTEYRKARDYCVIVLHENTDILNKENVQVLEFDFANFTIPDKDINFYKYPSARVSGINETNASEYELVVGRMPKTQNEIIVSEDFYQRQINSEFMWYDMETDSIMYDKESFMEATYSYINIHADKYNEFYSDEMNMYDFLQEVTIVGVYIGNDRVDYVVMQEVFEKVLNEYCEYGCVSEYGITIRGDDTLQLVKDIEAKGFRINEPSIAKIYEFREMLISVRPILQIVLAVVMAITVLVLFSYINFSININGRQIGILRAIGVSKKDTIKIFVAEIGIITIIALVLSFVFDWLIMEYVNDFYMEGVPEKFFDIIVPNFWMCLILPAVTVVIAITSTILPINTLAKLKPVEIIRAAKE